MSETSSEIVRCRICGRDVGPPLTPAPGEPHSYYCSVACYEGGMDAIAGTRSTIGVRSTVPATIPALMAATPEILAIHGSEERVEAIRRGDPEAIRAWAEDDWVCHSELARAALRGLLAALDEHKRYADDAETVVAELLRRRAAERDRRQAEVAAWVERVFGAESLATEERALRFVEEAVELAQATGLSAERVRAVAEHVYARPAGEVAREVGGVGVTLVALCAVLGVSAEAEEVAEVARVFAADPEHMRERHERKVAVGIAVAAQRGENDGNGGET